MNILLIWPFFPPEPGAAAARGRAFIEHLGKKHQVHLVAKKNQKVINYPNTKTVKWITFYTSLIPWKFIHDLFVLHKEIAYHKPDVIIVSIPSLVLGLHAVIVARINGIRLLVDVRDTLPSSKFKNRCLQNLIYRSAELLFITTLRQHELIQDTYNINDIKMVLVPNGVSTKYTNSSKDCSKMYDLVHYGALVPERDLRRLQELLVRVLGARPSTTIAIIGFDNTNEQAREFVKQIMLKTKNSITIYEELPHEKAFDVLQKARIGLLSLSSDRSYSYQLPVKLYEYLAAKLAVAMLLPLHSSASEDFIEKYKCGISSKSIVMLAGKIIKLLDNEKILAEYQKKNHEIALSFSREEIMKVLDDYIQS